MWMCRNLLGAMTLGKVSPGATNIKTHGPPMEEASGITVLNEFACLPP